MKLVMLWVTKFLVAFIKDKDGCASFVCAVALSLDAVTRPALYQYQYLLLA